MKTLKRKKTLVFSLIVSLFGVFVAAISTVAWFQIDSQPLNTSMVTGSSSINISGIDGLKKEETVDPATGLPSASNIITRKSYSTGDITTNNDVGTEDLNFDVPSEGIGYYIIKKNPGGTFKYKYNGLSYATKLVYDYSSANKCYVNNYAISADDVFRIKHYTFDNHETVNLNLAINSAYPTSITSIDSITKDVKVTAAGTYRVWFDYSNTSAYKIGFENINKDIDEYNIVPSARHNTTVENSSILDRLLKPKAANYDYILIGSADGLQWNTSDQTYGLYYHNDGQYYFRNDVSLTKDTIFRIHSYQSGADWGGTNWNYTHLDASGADGFFANNGDGDNNFKVKQTGVYNFKFQNSKIYITFAETDDYIAMMGAGTLDGTAYSNWDLTSTTYGLTWDSTNSQYVYHGYFAADSTFRIYRPRGDTGNNGWGSYEWGYSDLDTSNSNATSYLSEDSNAGVHSIKFSTACAVSIYFKPYASSGEKIIVNKKVYSVTLNPVSGTINSGNVTSYTYGTGATLPVKANMSRAGYIFSGWYDNSSYTGNAVTSISTTAWGDKEYWAKWTGIAGPSGDTYTVQIYDPNNYLGAAPYIYAWNDNTEAVYPANTGLVAMTSGTLNGNTIWTADVSISYPSFLINNKDSWTSNIKTEDLSSDDVAGVYVITGNGTAGSPCSDPYVGHWYGTLANTATSTYYFYANRSSGRWAAPSAYAWCSDYDSDEYAIYPHQNAAWPGTSMTQFTAQEASAAGIEQSYAWKISVSTSYDKIIFNKGAGASSETPGDQTVDLTTTSHSNQYFVLTGSVIDAGDDINKWDGEWSTTIYGITFMASYFIVDFDDTEHKSSLTSETLSSENSFGIFKYTPSYNPGNSDTRQVSDTVNAIHYKFTRDISESNWYTDEACTTPFSEGSAALSSSIILYTKYVTDMDDYSTMYIDDKNTGWGDSLYVMASGGDAYYFQGFKVCNNLFRITLPSDWMVKFHNSSTTGYAANNTWTDTLNFASYSSCDYFVINSSGTPRGITKATLTTENPYGTAKIQYYDAGVWKDLVTLKTGDGASNNYFIDESGSQVAVGTLLRAVVSDSNVDSMPSTFYYANYQFDGTYSSNDNLQYYLAKDGSLKEDASTVYYIKTANYTGNARFNFYITNAKTLSIAMVPDLGNGYYIMDYNSSYGTNNYIGSKKMSSSSEYSAFYNGFYAVASTTQIYIRSYIDAVDRLYKTSGSICAGASLNTTTGVISFTSTGYYDISVVNGKITIESYVASDFFKLNKVNTNRVDTAEHIKNQNTALILEVKFKSTNPYASNLTLEVNNTLSKYVGVALYVSNSQLSDSNAYNLATTYRNQLSNESVIYDQNNLSIPANSDSFYYAYIVIDYIPEVNNSYDDFLSDYSRYNLAFYLNSIQPSA